MSSAAGSGDGDRSIVAELKAEFPAPLDILLINLYDRNRDYWLSPQNRNTIGAESVRQSGLTPPQWEWAVAIREQMRGPHPMWDGEPLPEAAPEEIVSDTSVEDVFGGDLR